MKSFARVYLPLPGPWWFRRSATHVPEAGGTGFTRDLAPEDEPWMPATVPGCVHTDLLANGQIGDPFEGQNERDQQWIERCDWEYRTTLRADESLRARQRIDLVCSGLDTFATVWINEHEVLRANNMFRPWRVDIRPFLMTGENQIRVQFRSPTCEVDGSYRDLGYVLPASNDQGSPMVSMFARKAPYHYGWDWGPRLVTSGIWRPIGIELWDLARIDDVSVLHDELSDERAKLRIRVTASARKAVRALLRVAVGEIQGAQPGDGVDAAQVVVEIDADLSEGESETEAHLTIDRPRRWWPNGLGAAHLYRASAALWVDGQEIDARSVRFGLRSLEVLHGRDGDGKSFAIHINGALVFMKGANYIPLDSFPSRASDDRYRFLLESAARSNMNMIRVWGGGVYEDDRFYDLCDELGILVWQDFMFACSMYPGDDDFVENVRQEAIQNVRRLRNHACLALWAGNNEIEVGWHRWAWQKKFALSQDAQRKMWSDYERIFHDVLPRVTAEQDPSRFYTRSSPSANDDGVVPDTLGFGDMHYWGVWHAERPYTDYADNVSRFMSEYGFQSFPELDTVRRYAPPAERRIDSPVMIAHQRHPRGNELIRTYMERDFRRPKDFESFLYVSQVLQATIIKYAAEEHRRRMPYCAGSLYWQLDDCWPVASWSSIDYFGCWKALQYFAARFFAPILVVVVDDGRSIAVHVVSDRRETVAATLLVRLLDFDGAELWRDERAAHIEANRARAYISVERAAILGDGATDRLVLAADLVDGSNRLSRSLHYFVPPKDLWLPDPELTVHAVANEDRSAKATETSAKTPTQGHDGEPRYDTGSLATASFRVEAKRFAKSVRLVAGASRGRFSDNYFDLLAGEAVTVTFYGTLVDPVTATSIRDTY